MQSTSAARVEPALAPGLDAVLNGTPYQSYCYAYPHKTAYGPLPPAPLERLWAGENRSALSLYVHVPFCEMRCGFCNLFTAANAESEAIAAHQGALYREMDQVAGALGGEARFARLAIGGGTPSILGEDQLETLFERIGTRFGVDPWKVPSSFEVSPGTVSEAKMRLLARRGVERVSIGVQAFAETQLKACGRPQGGVDVAAALDHIREAGIRCLNIDLIYGINGQDAGTWLASLREVLRWSPEELYLYPLYVRPLTGLDRRAGEQDYSARAGLDRPRWDAQRLELYRLGRDFLLVEGYEQVSMRMFRRRGAAAGLQPEYCCQSDGMVGLGCGARSYTRARHYSNEFAVSQRGVKAILAAYSGRSDEAFGQAAYGFELDAWEQRRRWLIQSLLQAEGLSRTAYRGRFGSEVLEDFPQLRMLCEAMLAEAGAAELRLNAAGLERSDAIGPWLFSAAVRGAMGGFELR